MQMYHLPLYSKVLEGGPQEASAPWLVSIQSALGPAALYQTVIHQLHPLCLCISYLFQSLVVGLALQLLLGLAFVLVLQQLVWSGLLVWRLLGWLASLSSPSSLASGTSPSSALCMGWCRWLLGRWSWLERFQCTSSGYPCRTIYQ